MIALALTIAELEAHRACARGLNAFRAAWGEELRIAEWTPLHSVWLAVAWPTYVRWARKEGLIPGASLAGANLAGAYLARAYLAGAYLAGASLAGANLRGADLTGASLAGADLDRAKLRGADLTGGSLAGAALDRASLAGANLGDWERGPDGYARGRT